MKALVAEFASAEAIVASAMAVRRAGFPLFDALTPYQVPALTDCVGGAPPRLRGPMAMAGFGVATFAFGFQWWSTAASPPVDAALLERGQERYDIYCSPSTVSVGTATV